MADPLSNLQNTESMEHSPADAVDEALKLRRKRKKQNELPPSKMACALGEQMLKAALTTDSQTSCQYGNAALAGIRTAKPRGAKVAGGDGWGNVQGTTSPTSAPGVAKMAQMYPELMKASGYWSEAFSGLNPLNAYGGTPIGALAALLTKTRSLHDQAKSDTGGVGVALQNLLVPGVGPYRVMKRLGTSIRGPELEELKERERQKQKGHDKGLADDLPAKAAALAYPALAKYAAGAGPGAMPGAGNTGSVGAGPSGATGSVGSTLGGGLASGPGQLAQAPGGVAGGTIGAGGMPPAGGAAPGMPGAPKPMNTGSMGLSTAGSGGLKI